MLTQFVVIVKAPFLGVKSASEANINEWYLGKEEKKEYYLIS